MSGSTERNAVIADTTTGKNDSRNTSSTFGNRPKPNQMIKSGATAIFGTIWKKISSGYSVCSMRFEKATMSASAMPMTTAAAKPSSIGRSV